VDYVSGEASLAGKNAAEYIRGEQSSDGEVINIKTENGVRYSVPSLVRSGHMPDTLTVRFRVGNEYRDTNLGVYLDGEQLMKLPKRVMAPGEMEQVILVKSKVMDILSRSDRPEHEVVIRVED
jgi:hypothetical protein